LVRSGLIREVVFGKEWPHERWFLVRSGLIREVVFGKEWPYKRGGFW
jgi:hypothetical protein